jgi:hypothetical protein
MPSRIALAALLAAFAVTAPPAPAALAQRSASQSDEAEIKVYRLTMDKMRKFAAASEAMAKAAETDPRLKAIDALEKEIAALEKKDQLSAAEEKRLDDLRTKLEAEEAKLMPADTDNAPSLDAMAKRIESVPALANAIRGAGLTPREYSLMSLVTIQAVMAHGFMKSSGGKELPRELAATMLADNVKFVADNEAEITRLLERLKTLERKAP